MKTIIGIILLVIVGVFLILAIVALTTILALAGAERIYDEEEDFNNQNNK